MKIGSITAQGTIEYLVIIAAVVVVALIVVAFFAGVFTQSSAVTETQSKQYWLAQSVGIYDAAVDLSGDGSIVVANNSGEVIEITSLKINNVTYPVSGRIISGDKLAVTFSGLPPCVDDKVSFPVEINYSTANGLDQTMTGAVDLVASCASNIFVASFFSLDGGVEFDLMASPNIFSGEEGYLLLDSNLFNSFSIDDFGSGTDENTSHTITQVTLGQAS